MYTAFEHAKDRAVYTTTRVHNYVTRYFRINKQIKKTKKNYIVYKTFPIVFVLHISDLHSPYQNPFFFFLFFNSFILPDTK